MRSYKSIRLTIGLLFISATLFSQITVNKDTILMGSSFSFTAVHDSPAIAEKALNAAVKEVVRIEALISSWDEKSVTSEINRNAGIAAIKVPDELFNLINRAKKISVLSNGYFDISYASIDEIWDFTTDSVTIPTADQLLSSIGKINFENIILDSDNKTVYLAEEGMKIGFGSIGKGFAANRAKIIMIQAGVNAGVVNAGGDLIAWGEHPEKKPWTIGIVNPLKKNEVAIWLDINETAVVTSGNYEKYIEINSEKYCHIINPKTGWPSRGLSSVTIVCVDAEFADALATTVFVLGVEEGMKIINHLEGVEGVLIDDFGSVFYSKNLEKNETE